MITGIDVSSWQSTTPDLTGKDFCIIKATESTTYINPKQTAQAAHARAAGLVVGFYHFLHPGDLDAQARYFVDTCDSVVGDFLAIDWETSSTGIATCAEKDTFIRRVKALRPDKKVLLYCNRDFWLNRDTTSYAGDGLWIADYVTAGRPRIQADWLIHQYTDTPIDTDLARFDTREQMRAWAGGTTSTRPGEYEPFPGADWFKSKPNSPIITAMGHRLVAEGCSAYTTGPGPQWTDADRESFRKRQRKLGDAPPALRRLARPQAVERAEGAARDQVTHGWVFSATTENTQPVSLPSAIDSKASPAS